MMAIRYEPSERRLATLYDRPSQGLMFSRKTLLAFGAVGLLYAGFGAMVLSFKITHAPAVILEPPVIKLDQWTPDKPPPPREPVKTDRTIPIHEPTTTAPLVADPLPLTPLEAEGAPEGPPTTINPGPERLTTTAPPPAGPMLIKSPEWVSKPTPAQLGRLYPERAAVEGRTGGATLLCGVAANGAMVGCTVIDESPKGWRFGQAALASARYFKMSPRTVDGQVVEGAKVRIPIIFNQGD